MESHNSVAVNRGNKHLKYVTNKTQSEGNQLKSGTKIGDTF